MEALTVHKISETVTKVLKNEKDVVILGDFNMSPDCPGESRFFQTHMKITRIHQRSSLHQIHVHRLF